MKLETLADHLLQYSGCITVGKADLASVFDAEIFAAGQEVYDPAVLYLLDAPVIARADWEHGAINLLYINGSGTPELLPAACPANVITVRDGLQIDLLLAEVRGILEEYRTAEDAAMRLFELLFQKAGLTQILDAGAAYLHSPLFLVSADRTPIAFTHGISAAGDLQTLAFGLKITKMDARQRGVEKTIARTSDATGAPWVVATISGVGRLAAYLCVPERGKILQPADLGLLEALNKVITLELAKQQYHHFFAGKTDEQLVQDLIQGGTQVDQSAVEILLKHGWNARAGLHLLVIKAASTRAISLLQRKIGTLIPSSKFAVYEGNLLVVISRDKQQSILPAELVEVRRVLENSGVSGGLSRWFSDLYEIGFYYRQVIDTIEIGQRLEPDKPLYLYDHYVFGFILGMCAQEADLLQYCRPDLLTLREYDKKNKTHFVDTVRAYIRHNGNYKATAQDLHIQLSTLTYRMKKIREIMRSDLDENNFFQIELSVKILEYLKMI